MKPRKQQTAEHDLSPFAQQVASMDAATVEWNLMFMTSPRVKQQRAAAIALLNMRLKALNKTAKRSTQ